MFMCLYVDINQQRADRVAGKRDLSRRTEENRITQYSLHKTGKGGYWEEEGRQQGSEWGKRIHKIESYIKMPEQTYYIVGK